MNCGEKLKCSSISYLVKLDGAVLGQFPLNICPSAAEGVSVISYRLSLSVHCSALQDFGFFSVQSQVLV